MPSIADAVDLNLRLGRRTNPAIRCAGVGLDTAGLDEQERRRALQAASDEACLPAADPMQPSAALDRLVESCLAAARR